MAQKFTLGKADEYIESLESIEKEYPNFKIIKTEVFDSEYSFYKMVRMIIETN